MKRPSRMPLEKIPEQIARIRRQKHLTASDCAKRMKIPLNTWRRFEEPFSDKSSTKGVRLSAFYAILDVLSVSIEEFIFWPDEPWYIKSQTPEYDPDQQTTQEELSDDGPVSD